MRELHISPTAEDEIVNALAWSIRNFGEFARIRYEILIATALNGLCADPADIHG